MFFRGDSRRKDIISALRNNIVILTREPCIVYCASKFPASYQGFLLMRKTLILLYCILFRSVYPFNTPGAFVPHSAINLSRTKEDESPVTQSLDLSVSEASTAAASGQSGS